MQIPGALYQELPQSHDMTMPSQSTQILARGQCEILLVLDGHGHVKGVFSLEQVEWGAPSSTAITRTGLVTKISSGLQQLWQHAKASMCR